MAVVYVDTPRTVVSKQGETVTLRGEGVTALSVPFSPGEKGRYLWLSGEKSI